MPMKTVEELFLSGLSDVHAREQHLAQIWEQLSQQVEDPEIKNILSVRAYLGQQAANNIEKCFQILGKQRTTPNVRLYQTVAENVRSTFDAIEQPALRAIYALKEVRSAHNWAIGEYAALTTMAAAVGNLGVAGLLEHNLADKVEFVEHRRELLRDRIMQATGARRQERAA